MARPCPHTEFDERPPAEDGGRSARRFSTRIPSTLSAVSGGVYRETLRQFADQSGLVLQEIHHTTNLYGGSSGRGVLRHALVRAIGGTTDDFFALYRSTRRERFGQGVALAAAWTAVGVVERLVLTDWLTRLCRISGQIVTIMAQPPDSDP